MLVTLEDKEVGNLNYTGAFTYKFNSVRRNIRQYSNKTMGKLLESVALLLILLKGALFT